MNRDKAELARLMAESAADNDFKKIISPEEKAARTQGRMAGRISAKQVNLLRKLGCNHLDLHKWTKYRASKEIEELLKKR